MVEEQLSERIARYLLVMSVSVWIGSLFTWTNVSIVRSGTLWSANLTDGAVSLYGEPCIKKPNYIKTCRIKWRLPGMFGLLSPYWSVNQQHKLVAIQIPLLIPICFLAAILILKERLKRRNLAPQCHRCGYSLIANRSGTCPECGTVIPEEQLARLRNAGIEPLNDSTRPTA
jgi:ribosomal protein L37E